MARVAGVGRAQPGRAQHARRQCATRTSSCALNAAAKSVNRSVNIALSYVMLLGVKREAERQSGKASVLRQR